uniref:Uncharacterized protein n=1 Tax=Trichogramma kaykai TaxID=54128 RepID=A0ABD2XMB2_9HYME
MGRTSEQASERATSFSKVNALLKTLVITFSSFAREYIDDYTSFSFAEDTRWASSDVASRESAQHLSVRREFISTSPRANPHTRDCALGVFISNLEMELRKEKTKTKKGGDTIPFCHLGFENNFKAWHINTRQFHFKFDEKKDVSNPESTNFLVKQGYDFHKLLKDVVRISNSIDYLFFPSRGRSSGTGSRSSSCFRLSFFYLYIQKRQRRKTTKTRRLALTVRNFRITIAAAATVVVVVSVLQGEMIIFYQFQCYDFDSEEHFGYCRNSAERARSRITSPPLRIRYAYINSIYTLMKV